MRPKSARWGGEIPLFHQAIGRTDGRRRAITITPYGRLDQSTLKGG